MKEHWGKILCTVHEIDFSNQQLIRVCCNIEVVTLSNDQQAYNNSIAENIINARTTL